jgi:hypothetical protein
VSSFCAPQIPITARPAGRRTGASSRSMRPRRRRPSPAPNAPRVKPTERGDGVPVGTRFLPKLRGARASRLTRPTPILVSERKSSGTIPPRAGWPCNLGFRRQAPKNCPWRHILATRSAASPNGSEVTFVMRGSSLQLRRPELTVGTPPDAASLVRDYRYRRGETAMGALRAPVAIGVLRVIRVTRGSQTRAKEDDWCRVCRFFGNLFPDYRCRTDKE